MITKEQFQAKVKSNRFQQAIDKAALDLNRDIISARHEMMPFGSAAKTRHIQREVAWKKLVNEIYLAKNS